MGQAKRQRGGKGPKPRPANPRKWFRLEPARPEAFQAAVEMLSRLEEAGYETYLVGGSVRDLLAGIEEGDWDLATQARPEEVMALFSETVPVGLDHGTVGVRLDGHVFEVTTFRRDVKTFGRRAEVEFAETIEEDLARRDFTINALAWHPGREELVDPYGGADDLGSGVLRTVGKAAQRFEEDHLRLLRAVRFAARFNLEIAPQVWEAMVDQANLVTDLSAERVRDELLKIMGQCRRPSHAILLMHQCRMLDHLLPEVEACFGVEQNRYHRDDVGRHSLMVMDAVSQRFPFLRLVALLHDIGKPVTRAWNEETGDWSFYGHAEGGAEMVEEILGRLRFSAREMALGAHLVRHHLRLPTPEATDSTVRRWIRTIGVDHLRSMFRLHFADWQGNRAKEGSPVRLRQLCRRVRRLLAEDHALKVTDLAIDGEDLKAMGLEPGPIFSRILDELLERVLEDPSLNRSEKLLPLARELASQLAAEE